MEYEVRITIDLVVIAGSAKEAVEVAENTELPYGYKEDSFELVGVKQVDTH